MDGRQIGRLGLGLGTLTCIGLAALVIYHKATRAAGPVEEAEQFLKLLATGKADTAYTDGARALRRRKTAGMLTLDAKALGLRSYARSSWPEVHLENREASLEGAVTTKGGEVIPLVVKLVKEEDRWRVLSIAAAPPKTEESDGGGAAASTDSE